MEVALAVMTEVDVQQKYPNLSGRKQSSCYLLAEESMVSHSKNSNKLAALVEHTMQFMLNSLLTSQLKCGQHMCVSCDVVICNLLPCQNRVCTTHQPKFWQGGCPCEFRSEKLLNCRAPSLAAFQDCDRVNFGPSAKAAHVCLTCSS